MGVVRLVDVDLGVVRLFVVVGLGVVRLVDNLDVEASANIFIKTFLVSGT